MPRSGGVIATDVPKDELRAFRRRWNGDRPFGSVPRSEEFRADIDVV